MPKLILTVEVPEGFDTSTITAEVQEDVKVAVEPIVEAPVSEEAAPQ